MEQLILQDETVDDLQNGYRIIQKSHSFRFGVDAVLLADFANIKHEHSVNGLDKSIKVLCMDLKDTPKLLGKARYDCVVTNPPYVKKECGINNPSESKAIARFEIMCSLEEVLMTARELLKPGGKFYMVHRTDRLADIIYEMRSTGIEPKRIRFVHPSIGKRPNLLLIEGARGGNKELKFMDPLYIHDEKGEYTEEIHRIYGRTK
jgi:tRNA1Val (adenine37-N6)-methyltransferase